MAFNKPLPAEIFYDLVLAMAADNGCPFSPTITQCARAEASIAQLLDRGWSPKHSTVLPYCDGPYDNDVYLLTSGEHTDVQALVKHWGENMRIVNDVLNEVFDAA